jgi:hypothetical protein
MKKFIVQSVIFAVISLVFIQIVPCYRIHTGNYKQSVAGVETYYSLSKSKQKNSHKVILLLGDSVGWQLFPNVSYNDTINSLACNQAIGLVGQYILLKNYLELGNQVDTVILVYSPFSFRNNLDQVYTYHYFLKPLYIDEYKPVFTKTVNTQIRKIPYYYLCRVPSILTSNWAPDFASKDSVNYTFFSPISLEYLKKIKDLCAVHKLHMVILPPPIAIQWKPIIDKSLKYEIEKNSLTEQFANYTENIIYVNNSEMRDHDHLYHPRQYTEVIRSKFAR